MVRVFSIVYLAFLLVVRLADEDDHVCPSLEVEMEKCENEKQRAISAEKDNHSASVNAMKVEAGEVRRKLEKERDQCLKSLEKSKSGLVECTAESESWKKTMEGKMKAKKTEHEASLTKLQKQISLQKEELEQMEKKEKATLAKLRKKHADKEQELTKKLADKEEKLKKKLADKEKELTKSKKAAAKKLASEKEKLVKAQNLAMDQFSKQKVDELASQEVAHKAELEAILKEKANVEALLAEKEKRLVTQSKEFEEKSGEITRTKEQLKELRHQNTESLQAMKELSRLNEETEAKNIQLEKDLAEIMRRHGEIATKKDEQAKRLEEWQDEFVSIRARHVEEKAKLKKKTEVEIRKMEKKLSKMEKKLDKLQGDVLFGGSWMQVPKGWNGVLSLDLRLFRSLANQLWSRVVGDRKIVGSIPKEYRDLFSNGMKLLNEIPSLDDLHKRYTIIFAAAKDVSAALVKDYSPLVKETGETLARSWEKASTAGGEFHRKNIQPHLEDVSSRVNKLYVENEIGPLYVDPARQAVMDIAQPIYQDTIHPLYQDYVLSTVENIPQYRSQMKTFAVRVEKDLRGGWRMTKNWGRVAQSQFETRSAFVKQTYALWWSAISVEGQAVFKRVSAPLKLFGGKVRFSGGVLEATAVGVVALLVAWYSASYLRFAFGVARFIVVSAYTIIRFLLVTLLLKLVVYTIAWRFLILGSIMSLFYLLSIVLRIVGLAIKVVFFPIKVALKLVKCVLKCMCCCGLFCRGGSKSGKSSAPGGSQTKGMNGKRKKVSSPSTNDSSTSSDEGKHKKGKKRNKKVKQGSKGNSTKGEKKKKKKRGGK